MNETPPAHLERILGLTAFAAGTVDIISFAKLGGIFASAMTGNLAFLGLYLSRFSFAAALGSAIALLGFVAGGSIGTLLGRNRERDAALRALLGVEIALLAAAAMLWLPTSHKPASLSCEGLIVLLSVAMGLQSIIGKKVNLSNIPTVVFTSTLTNMVIALTDMVTTRSFKIPVDTKRQSVSFWLYFGGALLAGFIIYLRAPGLILLPVLAIGLAFFCLLKDV